MPKSTIATTKRTGAGRPLQPHGPLLTKTLRLSPRVIAFLVAQKPNENGSYVEHLIRTTPLFKSWDKQTS